MVKLFPFLHCMNFNLEKYRNEESVRTYVQYVGTCMVRGQGRTSESAEYEMSLDQSEMSFEQERMESKNLPYMKRFQKLHKQPC